MTAVRTVNGELVKARYVRHLRTLTGAAEGPIDVDLYRTEGGRLVVCTCPANDGRAIPDVDPDSAPADDDVSLD